MGLEESRNPLGPYLLTVEGGRNHVENEKLEGHRVVHDSSGFHDLQELFWPRVDPEEHRCGTTERFGEQHQGHEAILCPRRVGAQHKIGQKEEKNCGEDAE